MSVTSKQEHNANIALYNEKKQAFLANMTTIFAEWQNAMLLKNKLIVGTKLFATINSDFEYLYYNDNIYYGSKSNWNNFAEAICNKIKELRTDLTTHGWNVDKHIVDELLTTMDNCEIFIKRLVIQSQPETQTHNNRQNKSVKNTEPTLRKSPRKNIKRIDYSQFY